MPLPELPREIIYVQKLHYLIFLIIYGLALTISVTLFFHNWYIGLGTLFVSVSLSYYLAWQKQEVTKPEKVAHQIAENFVAQQFSAHSAAVTATQIYYLLGDFQRAECLLRSYLPTQEPFIYTTLADIYLGLGQIDAAAQCLNGFATLEHPLIQLYLGRVFLQQKKFSPALKHLELSRTISEAKGLPKTKGWLHNHLMHWSIKAALFHALADCHLGLGNNTQARQYRRHGNSYIIYPGLWYR